MNLYHYCSSSALISILKTREIWASDLSLSNDLLEGKWIRKVFTDHCADRKVAAPILDRLLVHLDGAITFLGAVGFCLSEEADLLSQWRGYAEDGSGISIGFSREYLELLGTTKRDRGDEFNAKITKVEYDYSRQRSAISDQTDKIIELAQQGALTPLTILTRSEEAEEKRNKLFNQIIGHFAFFIFNVYSMKNPAFAEEREWRLISHVVPEKENTSSLSRMDFRALRDRIVPYRKISLERLSHPSIVDIVLGPKNITPEPIIAALLQKHDWNDVKVRRSAASYR